MDRENDKDLEYLTTEERRTQRYFRKLIISLEEKINTFGSLAARRSKPLHFRLRK